MTEIRADDLRFTTEEAAAFLNRALGLTLDADKVAVLEARTEGWIAGLQLAALSLRGRKDVAGFIDAFSGSNRHVIDYLAAEVLAQQPDELRDFLCQTSILDQLTAPLCQFVTGKENSLTLLRQLEQANLFLAPLDQRGEWYRYHRLFADFLRTELQPHQRTALHLKAARWHEENHLLPQAVEHALASGDVGESVRLIAQVGDWALSKCMIATVLGWLDTLPDEIVRADGTLASHKAWALFVTGHTKEASAYVRSVEANLREDSSSLDRGRLLSLQCNMAEPPEVVELARKALDLIGDADPFARGITLFMLGDAQDKIGDVAGAIETF
jgi:LuxR family maltose regulon positive regulatory protein